MSKKESQKQSPKKMTVEESQTWISANVSSLILMKPDEYIQALKNVMPKKPRSSGPGSHSAEGGAARSLLEFDPLRCKAGVYVGPRAAHAGGGFRAQCSSKISGECDLCNRHQAEADEHDGQVRNGFFNGDRPLNHYGDESDKLIPWNDVTHVKSQKDKAPKSSGVRCCSLCGEPGHNKTKCPHKEDVSDITDEELSSMPISKLKRHARALGITNAKLDLADDADDVKAFVIDLIHVASAKKAKKAQEEAEEEAQSHEEDEEEPKEEEEEEEEEEDDDKTVACSNAGDVADLDDFANQEAASDEDLDEDHTDDGAGTGLETTLVFEGVSYSRDGDEVLDDDLDTIGTWDGEKIDFNSAKNRKIHNLMAKSK